MADVRPFRALRFDPALDLGSLICPPYDVISPDLQHDLHRRSPYNVVRLEFGLKESPNEFYDPYQRAAETLRDWLTRGVLRLETTPSFYVHDQYFPHQGRQYCRRAIFARLRLEPWEAGIVWPHERTLGPPKEDRLRLLRASRCNTSPVFALYTDVANGIGNLLASATIKEPLVHFGDPDGQQHALWRVDDIAACLSLAAAFAAETLYVADGHHRYETALAYRDERKAETGAWTGEEPENFCLIALTAANDPGLLVLPIHRLVSAKVPLENLMSQLLPVFDVEVAPSLEGLLKEMARRGRYTATFGLIAADSPDFYLLTLVDRAALTEIVPSDAPAAWLSLDTAIFHYAILRHGLNIDEEAIADGEIVHYSERAEEALEQVRQGRYSYAFLLNPTPPAKVLAVAEAGHRLPQKSTYFYPKVPAGLVLNLLDLPVRQAGA